MPQPFRLLLPLAVAVSLACASGAKNTKEDAPPAAPPAPAAPEAKAAPPPAPRKLEVTAYNSSAPNASVNSYLLTGEREALLIDAQLVNSEATQLAALIRKSGKKLTTIFITHPHPDHFMGLQVLQKEFPDARIVARQSVGEAMPALFKQYEAPLNRFFPGDVASGVVPPSPIEGDTLKLEGFELRILDFQGGESSATSAVYVPSLEAVFCADMAYNKVHPWLNEMRIDGVLQQVDALAAMPDVDTLYPGHGPPMAKADLQPYKDYIAKFLETVASAKDSEDVIARMKAAYPDYQTEAGLRFSANAHVAARDAARPPAKPAGKKRKK
jgi:glyoxylase-like metal-dependent hydrolase (beta-lactamase superfamily II)